MRTAVATIQRGRHEHVTRQALAVDGLDPAPAEYLSVCMDSEPWRPPRGRAPRVLHHPVGEGDPLPLAAARNRAVEALAPVADLIVLLDADCLPARDLLGRYAAAAEATGGSALLAGPVGRLGPIPRGRARPTWTELRAARVAAGRSRPVPPDGEVVNEPRVELFWSLSFAVTPATHARIGGFDEGYAGYGAEDTDYGFRARAREVPFAWAGGAWAYHQHHPVSSPPYEHLDDIVANARRFRARWGRWPMEGWLRAFDDEGLVEWDPDGDTLRRSRAALSRVEASRERVVN